MKISVLKVLQFRLLFFLPLLIKEDRGLLPNLMIKKKQVMVFLSMKMDVFH